MPIAQWESDRPAAKVVEMNCKSCDASLIRTDRFCPACGTPNSETKYHPKLDRGRDELDPFVHDEEVTGKTACPRCRRLIHRSDEFCHACGLDLAQAWKEVDRAATAGVWTTPGPHNLDPYRRARLFATPLRLVLGISICAFAASGAVSFWLYARVSGGPSLEGPGGDTLRTWIDRLDLVGVITVAIGWITLVAWMNRAYRNLPALGLSGQRFAPWWAAAAFFVPIVNLFRPKQVVDDLWRASDPNAAQLSSSWRVEQVPVWSLVWWAGSLLGLMLAAAGHALMPESFVQRTGDLTAALFLEGFAGIVLAVSGLCLLVLVGRITDRQEVQAELIGEPRVGAWPWQKKKDEKAIAVHDGPALVRTVVKTGSVAGKY